MIETTDTTPVVLNVVDTTVTHVHVYDTTVHHFNVYDTVVTHVYDTVPPELITVYEQLLNSQDNKFDNILVTIGIFITLLVVAFAWFNLDIAKKVFQKDFKKIIKDEKPNIRDFTLSVIQKDLNFMKGENARLYAVINRGKHQIANRLCWWCYAIEYYIKANDSEFAKISIDSAIDALDESLKDIDIFIKSLKAADYDFSYFKKRKESCATLHDTVSEKKEILEKIDAIMAKYKEKEEKPEIEEVEIVE